MRKAEFDREVVLRSAMQAFQRKGFRKTTMTDLVEATGLHPGSLYCAFDNKRGILIAAARQYQQDRSQQLEACLDTENPLEGIKNYLHAIVNELACCDEANACLVAKAINELAEQDTELEELLSEIMVQTEIRIGVAFQQAIHQGKLSATPDAESRSRFLMMGIYGLRTYAHTHPGKQVLSQMAEQLLSSVCH